MTTDVSGCICGNEWMITTPIIYGTNQSIDCNGCSKLLISTEIIYHCTNIHQHPNGYDLCCDCHCKQLSNTNAFRCDLKSIGKQQTINPTKSTSKKMNDIIYLSNSSNWSNLNASKEETTNNSLSCYNKLFVTNNNHQKYNNLQIMDIQQKSKNVTIQNVMTDLNEKNNEMELEKEYAEILNERNNLHQKCLNLQDIICKNKEQEQDMKGKLNESQKKYDELLDEYKILDQKYKSEKDAFNKTMEERCNYHEEELRNLRVELNKQYEKQLKQRENEWREAKNRCIATLDESYGQLIEDKDKRINKLIQDVDGLNNDLNAKVSEAMQLERRVHEECKNLKFEIVTMKDSYFELQQQNECKIEELKKTITNRDIKLYSLQHQNDELLSKQQAMEKRMLRMNNLLEECKELEADRNEWIDKYHEVQDRNKQLQHRMEYERDQTNKMNAKCHLLEIRNSNVLASHDAKQRELDELEWKYTELTKKMNNDETETVNTDLNEGKECIVCMADDRMNAFVPCGHLCVCDKCKDESYDDIGICPVCKQNYTSIQKIYT